MQININKKLRFILLAMFVPVCLMVCASLACAQAANTKLIPFEFTTPPYQPREDVDISHWSRVCIMEMARGTFNGDRLNVQNAQLAQAWQELYANLKDADLDVKISGVNNFFNSLKIPEVSYDDAEPGEIYWPTPKEFIEREYYHSGGYAILKYFGLLALGVPETQMCLVVVEDTNVNSEHILLMVFNRDSFWLLDNKHNVMRPAAMSQYLTEYFINYESAWLPVINYTSIDINKVFPMGKTFYIFEPASREKSPVQSHKRWAAVFESERVNPTFNKDILNVGDAELKRQWKALYDELCDADIYEKIQKVNAFFNRNKYVTDIKNWGLEEYWATPREFMLKGRGDCEDYVLAKFYALKALGVSPANMIMVSVINDKPDSGHLVLAVSYAGYFYILDIGGNTIYRNGTKIAYRPRYYLNESGVWRSK